MGKTVVITQSNYLPWRGYFDMIRSADELILLDCVQFTRRDWRNRNVIKTPSGLTWLTVPVQVRGRYHQAIDETEISDPTWVDKHLRAICQRLDISCSISRCEAVIPRRDLLAMDATDRLVALARAVGATSYLSGPAAQAYMDVSRFTNEGIEVIWMSYEGYPRYPQLWGDFAPYM